jgi:hypothetical protein
VPYKTSVLYYAAKRRCQSVGEVHGAIGRRVWWGLTDAGEGVGAA